jgi:transcriptional regulatory protein GAL4
MEQATGIQGRAEGLGDKNPQTGETPDTDTLSRPNWSNLLSLESPPTAGDFEWDERSGEPGRGRFVDGMGSLTSDANGSGYLGNISLPR